jgi:hypothetical protein
MFAIKILRNNFSKIFGCKRLTTKAPTFCFRSSKYLKPNLPIFRYALFNPLAEWVAQLKEDDLRQKTEERK